MISKYLDQNNLHHAYLIEGVREKVVPEILKAVEELGVKTIGNADFVQITLDKFAVEDARNLKAFSQEKANTPGKKVFVISANNFLLDAQNTLLKMFEEPIENTHFFLIVPDASALLKTFSSRFYLIKSGQASDEGTKDVEKFLSMPLVQRIEYLKEFLVEEEESKEDSARSRALKFINTLEDILHKKSMSRFNLDTGVFHQIFKVRKFLRMPGSSTKSLMESVALVVPTL